MLEETIKNANMTILVSEEDYQVDGLWYCGKCHTKKQGEYNILGQVVRPMILCKCAAEELAKDEARMAEGEKRKAIIRMREVGFPDRKMTEWTFDADDGSNPKLTQAMRNYVENFNKFKKDGKGLLLYGSVGTGKTFASAQVANALIDKGIPALVTSISRVVNTIQGMYEGKQEYIDSLNRYDLVVLDDLGTERSTEYMQEQVFNIIDSRYRSGLPMIITSNLTMDRIKNPEGIVNQRIYDRVLERCFPIEVSGASRRRKIVRDSYEGMKEIIYG